MYVEERKDLGTEIKTRTLMQQEICLSIDNWISSEYGILNFSKTLREYFKLEKGKVHGALCRQIATSRIEVIAFDKTARHLGFSPISITFEEDSWNTTNQEKISLLKMPVIIGYDKKGNPIIQYEKIIDFPKSGTVLKSILIEKETLPRYHRRIRENIIPEHQDINIGNFFNYCLKNSVKKPEYVYEDQEGLAIKKLTCDADLSKSRPPAEWYYPLYLAMFCSGEMVLFETYENSSKEIEKIKNTFLEAVNKIKDNCGVYPLVIKIPTSKELLFYPKNIQLQRINTPLSDNCEEIFKCFADQIISMKKANCLSS